MAKENIVLIGGGGHAKVVIDAIKASKKFNIYGIVDANLPKGKSVLGTKVIGKDNLLSEIFKDGIKKAFISIASIGNCQTRKKIYSNLKNIGFQIPVIIHPKAVVAEDVLLGQGTFIAAGSVINPGVRTGKNAIINTSSSVDHDCSIGDFVHIAPGVTLSGGVKIGDETHVGTGASIIQNIKIGKKCLVRAGQTVIGNFGDGIKYGGSKK